jgi:hypothetical protein
MLMITSTWSPGSFLIPTLTRVQYQNIKQMLFWLQCLKDGTTGDLAMSSKNTLILWRGK